MEGEESNSGSGGGYGESGEDDGCCPDGITATRILPDGTRESDIEGVTIIGKNTPIETKSADYSLSGSFGLGDGGGGGKNNNQYRSQNTLAGKSDSAAGALMVGWGVALGEPTPVGEVVMALATTGAILYYGPDLAKKMAAEIEGIRQRAEGPQGFQYALTATRNGNYPNVRGGTTYLNKGEVWKYGETTKGEGRYSKQFYDTMGLRMDRQFYGNQMQIKIQEKIMIYGYFFQNGTLPPGNKIFR